MRRIVKDFIILSSIEKFYWGYLYITIKTAVEKYAGRPLIFQKKTTCTTSTSSLFWCRWPGSTDSARHSLREHPIMFGFAEAVRPLIFKKQKENLYNKYKFSFLVPVTGVEPVRYRYHWILSPARLPIPSHRQILLNYYIIYCLKNQYDFFI